VSVILCDAQGVVVSRRTGDSALEQHLDRVWLAPGFSYAEQFVGTNGIGTLSRRAAPRRSSAMSTTWSGWRNWPAQALPSGTR